MKPRINLSSSCAIGFSGVWQNSLFKLSIWVCGLNSLGVLWSVSKRFVSWKNTNHGMCVFDCCCGSMKWIRDKGLFLFWLLSCGSDIWFNCLITTKRVLMKVDPYFGSSIILVPADSWATCALWGRLAESQPQMTASWDSLKILKYLQALT